MTASIQRLMNRIPDRLIELAADMAFILFLVMEWLFQHSLYSRLAMVLFCLAAVLLILKKKRLYVHPAFALLGLMILWGFLTSYWALSGAVARAMVKTFILNLGVLMLLYQYLLLAKSGQHVQRLYMLAGSIFILCVVLFTPAAARELRLGQGLAINPNDVAIVAGTVFIFGFSMALGEPGTKARGKQLWWLLTFIPMMATVFYTSSLKGYALLFGMLVLYILIRYPKRWGLKAAGLIVGAALLVYVLSMEGFLARWPSIYYRITYRLQKLFEYLGGGGRHRVLSIIARARYFAIGAEAIAKKPFLGWGLDNFRLIPESGGTYSHNNFIELLVGGGLPLLVLYYTPIITGLVRSFRTKNRTAAQNALLTLALVSLPLDFVIVTYFERMSLVPILMLFAETERDRGATDLLPRIERYTENPCRLLAARGSRGGLRFLPDELYLRICYRGRMNARLNLDAPEKMTEKLQWMKLHDKNPLYPTLCDKLAVRRYVRELVGEEYLVPLLGAWDRAEDIDFTMLPERFALKCTHDSGGVRICADKNAFDKEEAIRFLDRHLNRNYYYCGREWWYRDVPAKVIAEEFIGSAAGTVPDDFKFFCFDGEVRCLVLCTNRTKAHADYYFLKPDFTPFPVNDITKQAVLDGMVFTPPASLNEMLALARTLSSGLAQVRVDLFDCNGKVYFGELTLCDQSGFADDYVDDGDVRMGDFYRLPRKN